MTGAVAFGAEPLATERRSDGTLVLPGAAVVRPVLGLPAARLVLVPLDVDGAGVVWAVLDREVLDVRSRGDQRRGAARPRRHPRRGHARVSGRGVHRRPRRAGHGARCDRARSRPRARRRREHRDRALVRGDGVGLRQGAGAVRSSHRPVPSREARAGRHARRGPSNPPRWPGTPPRPGARIRPSTPTTTGRALSAAIAGDIALEAATHCAKKCVQILGGIGFTWEHDAHFYLKRAMANLQLVTGGDIGALDHEVAALAVGGARRNLTADLPERGRGVPPGDP